MTVRLFGVAVIGALLVVVFYLAMNITNIVILLNDGMAERARVVTGISTDDSLLNKFFTEECLISDYEVQLGLAKSGIYKDYEIRSIDYRLSIEWIWSWPWDSMANATAAESIPSIDGRIMTARRDAVVAERGEEAANVPPWRNTRYKITLARIDGRWIISGLLPE